MLGAQIGRGVRDRLDLDEVPQPVDLVEMDACASPEQQPPRLLHNDQYTERVAESFLQSRWIADRYKPVAALTRRRLVSTLVGDEPCDIPLLAQLQPAAGNPEVCVGLLQTALVLCAYARDACRERAGLGSLAFSSTFRLGISTRMIVASVAARNVALPARCPGRRSLRRSPPRSSCSRTAIKSTEWVS
jgi:hypothetical protein